MIRARAARSSSPRGVLRSALTSLTEDFAGDTASSASMTVDDPSAGCSGDTGVFSFSGDDLPLAEIFRVIFCLFASWSDSWVLAREAGEGRVTLRLGSGLTGDRDRLRLTPGEAYDEQSYRCVLTRWFG